jgi:Tol biopolymer transport system component
MRFSPDGKYLLFGDQHAGENYSVFLRNLDGSPGVRLGDGDPLDLSPDDKWALASSVTPQSTAVQIAMLPTGVGDARQLTHSSVAHDFARWMPDGKHVIANGSEAGHGERAYLVDLDGNEKPITPEGVVVRAISPDGKQLLTRDADLNYALLPFEGGAATPLTIFQAGDIPLDFSEDGRAVYATHRTGASSGQILRVETASGKRTVINNVDWSENGATTRTVTASVSRDGKSFSFIYVRAAATEYLVTGLK